MAKKNDRGGQFWAGLRSGFGKIGKFFSVESESLDADIKPPPSKTSGQEMVLKFSLPSVAKATAIVLLVALLAYFAYQIREIILIVAVAFLLSAALMPTVQWLEKRRVPRALSVIVIYVIALSLLVVFLSSFVPTLGRELLTLGRNFGDLVLGLTRGEIQVSWLKPGLDPIREYLTTVDLNSLFVDFEQYLVDAGKQLTGLAGNAVAGLVTFSNGVLNLLLVLVLSFYFVVDQEAIHRFIVKLFPKNYEDYLLAKNAAIQTKIGYWLQGQLMLMLAVGAITYITLLILGVEYALIIAVVAGVMELLPVIGPLVAFVVAVPLVANQSIVLVLGVGIAFFVIQQLENNVLVPMIMKKAVGLNAIVVLLSMLIGFQFLGVLGVIIAVPVASTIKILLEDYIG